MEFSQSSLRRGLVLIIVSNYSHLTSTLSNRYGCLEVPESIIILSRSVYSSTRYIFPIHDNLKEIISLAEFISLLQMLYPKQTQILQTIDGFLTHHGIQQEFVCTDVFIYSRLLPNQLLYSLNKWRNFPDVLLHIIFYLLITFIVEDPNERISRDGFWMTIGSHVQ